MITMDDKTFKTAPFGEGTNKHFLRHLRLNVALQVSQYKCRSINCDECVNLYFILRHLYWGQSCRVPHYKSRSIN